MKLSTFTTLKQCVCVCERERESMYACVHKCECIREQGREGVREK